MKCTQQPTTEQTEARRAAAHFVKEHMMKNIPLRIKKSLAAGFLADSEFKQIDTFELMELARVRKHVFVADRASAIAVLKGVQK
jgi:hypothetical protein